MSFVINYLRLNTNLEPKILFHQISAIPSIPSTPCALSMAKLAIILVTLDNIDDEFASHKIEFQEMPPKTLTTLFEALDLLVSSFVVIISEQSMCGTNVGLCHWL